MTEEQTKFDTLFDFYDIVSDFDGAELRPMHVQGVGSDDPEGDDYWHKGHMFVVNTESNVPVQPVSPAYMVMQHAMFFSSVADQMLSNDIDAHGDVIILNDGNRVVTRMIFDNIFVEEPGMGNNLQLGAAFSNSYDKTSGLRGYAQPIRLSCTNQLPLRSTLAIANFSKAHVAKDEKTFIGAVDDIIGEFIVDLLAKPEIITKTIKRAQASQLTFKDEGHMVDELTEMFKVQSHAEAITTKAIKAAGGTEMSRWDLYNAATEYATHADLTHNVRDRLSYIAEDQILRKAPALVPVGGKA